MVQSLPALFNTAAVVLQAGDIAVGGESIWLWLGTAGMFLGMLAFIGMGWGETDQRRIEHYVITIFIPAIAFTMYLAMSLGFGVTGVQWGGETHAIYWARSRSVPVLSSSCRGTVTCRLSSSFVGCS
jgi:bacteriorhodopsin